MLFSQDLRDAEEYGRQRRGGKTFPGKWTTQLKTPCMKQLDPLRSCMKTRKAEAPESQGPGWWVNTRGGRGHPTGLGLENGEDWSSSESYGEPMKDFP